MPCARRGERDFRHVLLLLFLSSPRLFPPACLVKDERASPYGDIDRRVRGK